MRNAKCEMLSVIFRNLPRRASQAQGGTDPASCLGPWVDLPLLDSFVFLPMHVQGPVLQCPLLDTQSALPRPNTCSDGQGRMGFWNTFGTSQSWIYLYLAAIKAQCPASLACHVFFAVTSPPSFFSSLVRNSAR
jgi:hypothetical protein